MWTSLKILILLWGVNFAPPLLAYLFNEKGAAPLDGGRNFVDGRPLLGPHKTWRGLAGGVAMGAFLGWLLGFSWRTGALSGFLSMLGDLLSSFVKRRMDRPSGSVVPVLDQFFEGFFPFVLLAWHASLGDWFFVPSFFLFVLGAYWGSWFLKNVLLRKPLESYSRPLRPRSRMREWRACQVAYHPLQILVNLERFVYYHVLMKSVFRVLGVYERGVRRALDVRRRELEFYFQDLPPSFDGYTVLFLSDLHLDGLEGLPQRLQDLVSPLHVDLCLFGGDFRMEVSGPFSRVLVRLVRLVRHIRSRDGLYAVLGNHDCLEMVEILQRKGINFLINEAVAIVRGNERIWLVGVDDPHYYEAHDLERAFDPVPRGEFSLFAAHSPEIYKEAAAYGPRLYLCGHTHAGQIQLPFVGPVFTHTHSPRFLVQGAWSYKGMQGYTSAGVGASGVPVRFGCQGEVVVITLRRGTGDS